MRLTALLVVAVALVLYTLAVPTEASYWETEMSRVRKYAAKNFIDRIAKTHNVSTLPSGVLLSVIKRGHGDVAPAADDVCDIHYTGSFRFPAIFTNTRDYPYPVRRSPSQMIKPVQEALEMMREGDHWKIWVPYQLAYGEEGNGDAIPPFSNLIYDLEVFKCPGAKGKKSEEIDSFLAQYLKVPMPPKSKQIIYEDL